MLGTDQCSGATAMFETFFKLTRPEAGHRKKIMILTLLTFIALC